MVTRTMALFMLLIIVPVRKFEIASGCCSRLFWKAVLSATGVFKPLGNNPII